MTSTAAWKSDSAESAARALRPGAAVVGSSRPALNVFSGDIVPHGEVRFSIVSEFRAPATAEVDL
jgi:hypothetical protein